MFENTREDLETVKALYWSHNIIFGQRHTSLSSLDGLNDDLDGQSFWYERTFMIDDINSFLRCGRESL